ncbi:MAG: hypothetical protein ACLP52_04150 [Streptosporangiaceae bacterium]
MSYQYVCEPCRQALGLPAGRSYLNNIKREAGGFSKSGTPSKPPLKVVRRDPSGKPVIVGSQEEAVFVAFPASCSCACRANGHDPLQCTGAEQFKASGRPGSGAVDELAEKLGREPIPELVVARHEACQALVTYFLARRFGSSDEERIHLESSELSRMGYEEQLKLLRDILQEEHPELTYQKPYSEMVSNLRKLARFRNDIAHSWPVDGDFFTRSKRVKTENVTIRITPEELAEYLDMSMALQSQLWLLPLVSEVRRVA